MEYFISKEFVTHILCSFLSKEDSNTLLSISSKINFFRKELVYLDLSFRYSKLFETNEEFHKTILNKIMYGRNQLSLNLKYFANNPEVKFTNMMNICSLNLLYPELSDENLRYFEKIKNLIIKRSKNITDDGLKFLLNIETLDISYCVNVTDIGISYLKKIRNIKKTLLRLFRHFFLNNFCTLHYNLFFIS